MAVQSGLWGFHSGQGSKNAVQTGENTYRHQQPLHHQCLKLCSSLCFNVSVEALWSLYNLYNSLVASGVQKSVVCTGCKMCLHMGFLLEGTALLLKCIILLLFPSLHSVTHYSYTVYGISLRDKNTITNEYDIRKGSQNVYRGGSSQ